MRIRSRWVVKIDLLEFDLTLKVLGGAFALVSVLVNSRLSVDDIEG